MRATVPSIAAILVVVCASASYGLAAASAARAVPAPVPPITPGTPGSAPTSDGQMSVSTAVRTSRWGVSHRWQQSPAPAGSGTQADSQERPAPIPDASALAQQRPYSFVVVIDPGHGGDDVGSRGTGVEEKELTLDVARRLRTLLEKSGDVRVVMTRDADAAVSLDARAVTANAAQGDLFLSLHANTSPTPSASGAEVYSLQLDQVAEQVRNRVSAASIDVAIAGGGTRALAVLPWDFAQTPFVNTSATLAGIVSDQLRQRIPLAPSPRRTAPIRIAQKVAMPAVLLEMAYLTNAAQAKLVTSPEFRTTLAQVLFESVAQFRLGLAGTAGQ